MIHSKTMCDPWPVYRHPVVSDSILSFCNTDIKKGKNQKKNKQQHFVLLPWGRSMFFQTPNPPPPPPQKNFVLLPNIHAPSPKNTTKKKDSSLSFLYIHILDLTCNSSKPQAPPLDPLRIDRVWGYVSSYAALPLLYIMSRRMGRRLRWRNHWLVSLAGTKQKWTTGFYSSRRHAHLCDSTVAASPLPFPARVLRGCGGKWGESRQICDILCKGHVAGLRLWLMS